MSDHYETRCPSCGGSDEQGCYADCPTTVMSTLRAEVASKNEQFQQYARKMELDMNALAVENERLRAALREVAEYEIEEGCPCNACQHSAIARAALEGKP